MTFRLGGVDDMSDELAPCPFCGGPADIDAVACIVSCNNAGCQVSCIAYGDTLADGIAAWNHRAAPPPDPEKWDDLTAAGWTVDRIAELSVGRGFVCRFCGPSARCASARGTTLAECLNSIRRQVGIPERK